MADDRLVDGGSMDVETSDSVKKGYIEMGAATSGRFVSEELKDDDR